MGDLAVVLLMISFQEVLVVFLHASSVDDVFQSRVDCTLLIVEHYCCMMLLPLHSDGSSVFILP